MKEKQALRARFFEVSILATLISIIKLQRLTMTIVFYWYMILRRRD